MKKQDLLNIFDDELLNKLFAFCYARTNDSYEAEELCSDIVFALLKAANTDNSVLPVPQRHINVSRIFPCIRDF